MPRTAPFFLVLTLALAASVGMGCPKASKPPNISEVGSSAIDTWTDAEELEFGALVGYELLSRYGSTRYLPRAGTSEDGGTAAQADPRMLMLELAREAAAKRPLEEYLSGVLTRVGKQGARHEAALDYRGRERRFTVFVLETDEAYTCAAPGGLVFVTTGMLSSLQTEGELAFILGSEVAHVDREHALDVARLYLHASRNTVEDVLKHPTVSQGMIDAVLKALLETGLGRTREFEADRLALLYMTGADYDSTGPYGALDRLTAVENDETIGRIHRATHPRSTERKNQLIDPLDRLEEPYLDGEVAADRYKTAVLESSELKDPVDPEPDFDAPATEEGDDFAEPEETPEPTAEPEPEPSPATDNTP